MKDISETNRVGVKLAVSTNFKGVSKFANKGKHFLGNKKPHYQYQQNQRYNQQNRFRGSSGNKFYKKNTHHKKSEKNE